MKAIKILLLIITAVSISLLYAQQNNDLLKLDDILILGKTKGFIDSLRTVPEDTTFTRKSDLTEFKYDPYIKTQTVDKIASVTRPEKFFLHLDAGNDNIINSRLSFFSLNNGFLRFDADFHNDKFQNEWHNMDYSFSWLPSYKDRKGIFTFDRDIYIQADNSTEITGGSVRVPDWQISSAKNGSGKLSTAISYYYYNQTKENEDKKELNGSLDFEWNMAGITTGIYAGYQAENPVIKAWTGLDMTRLDKLALWFAADNIHIYPSLQYSKAFSLGKDFTLIIKNEPLISSSNRRQFMENNHYLDISPDYRQTKSILNHYLSLRYEGKFFINLLWNARYMMDRMNYTANDFYYEPQFLDLWENELSAQLKYEWRQVTLSENASYTIYSEDIYFAPVFELQSQLNYKYSKLNSCLAVNYNTGRYDSDMEYMKDMFMINLKFNYQLYKNIDLLLKAENIADIEYRRFDHSPAEGLHILGGFEVVF